MLAWTVGYGRTLLGEVDGVHTSIVTIVVALQIYSPLRNLLSVKELRIENGGRGERCIHAACGSLRSTGVILFRTA